MKGRSMGAEMFHADGRTKGLTELTVAFRIFANSPKNLPFTCQEELQFKGGKVHAFFTFALYAAELSSL